MLYDNVQVARLSAHAYQAWNLPLYRRIAIETPEYLPRDMRDPAGGFHSSEDADSEGQEGKFYVWDYAEFTAIAPEAAGWFRVSDGGNWAGANILLTTTD